MRKKTMLAARRIWLDYKRYDFTASIADDDWSQIRWATFLDHVPDYDEILENDEIYILASAVKKRFVLYLLKQLGVNAHLIEAIERDMDRSFKS